MGITPKPFRAISWRDIKKKHSYVYRKIPRRFAGIPTITANGISFGIELCFAQEDGLIPLEAMWL
jgi:hypothetical protein